MHRSHHLLHLVKPTSFRLKCTITETFDEGSWILLANDSSLEGFSASTIALMCLVYDETSDDKWTDFFAK